MKLLAFDYWINQLYAEMYSISGKVADLLCGNEKNILVYPWGYHMSCMSMVPNIVIVNGPKQCFLIKDLMILKVPCLSILNGLASFKSFVVKEILLLLWLGKVYWNLKLWILSNWSNSFPIRTVRETICLANAISAAEHMTDGEIKQMCGKLIDALSAF